METNDVRRVTTMYLEDYHYCITCIVREYNMEFEVNDLRDGGERRFMTGWMKWDGCCEFSILDQPNHFCSRSDLRRVSKLLDWIPQLAVDLIPHASRRDILDDEHWDNDE